MRWPVRTTLERFEDKVQKTDSCWLWTGAISRGYGVFHEKGAAGFKAVAAHRWSYQHHVGPIPDGLQIDHLCRVTRCVNPDHLEPVTAAENNARKPKPTRCPVGHAYDQANTYVYASKARNGGGMRCRECNRLYVAAKRAAASRRSAA